MGVVGVRSPKPTVVRVIAEKYRASIHGQFSANL